MSMDSGPMADQGSTDPYRRFAGYTRGLAEHTTWLPGNHDDAETMAKARPPGVQLCGHRLLGGGLVLALNARVAGQGGGSLAAAERARARRRRAARPDRAGPPVPPH